VAIESIPPALYLAMPYYAKWLYVREQGLLKSGLVTAQELRNPNGRITIPKIPGFRPAAPAEVLAALAQDSSSQLKSSGAISMRDAVTPCAISRSSLSANDPTGMR
jgi:hypothetical protein